MVWPFRGLHVQPLSVCGAPVGRAGGICGGIPNQGPEFFPSRATTSKTTRKTALTKCGARVRKGLHLPLPLRRISRCGTRLRRGLHAGFQCFDADGVCVYCGQFDGSRPGNDIPVTGKTCVGSATPCLLARPFLQKGKSLHRLQHQMEGLRPSAPLQNVISLRKPSYRFTLKSKSYGLIREQGSQLWLITCPKYTMLGAVPYFRNTKSPLKVHNLSL